MQHSRGMNTTLRSPGEARAGTGMKLDRRRSLVVAGVLLAATATLACLALRVFWAHRALRDLQAEWQALQPGYERAQKAKADWTFISSALGELQGSWRGHSAWGQRIQELLHLAPEPFALAKLDLQTRFEFVEGRTQEGRVEGMTVRRSSLMLAGTATKDDAESLVRHYIENIQRRATWDPPVERVRHQGLKQRRGRLPAGALTGTVFAIDIALAGKPLQRGNPP